MAEQHQQQQQYVEEQQQEQPQQYYEQQQQQQFVGFQPGLLQAPGQSFVGPPMDGAPLLQMYNSGYQAPLTIGIPGGFHFTPEPHYYNEPEAQTPGVMQHDIVPVTRDATMKSKKGAKPVWCNWCLK